MVWYGSGSTANIVWVCLMHAIEESATIRLVVEKCCSPSIINNPRSRCAQMLQRSFNALGACRTNRQAGAHANRLQSWLTSTLSHFRKTFSQAHVRFELVSTSARRLPLTSRPWRLGRFGTNSGSHSAGAGNTARGQVHSRGSVVEIKLASSMQPTSIFPLACQLEPNELRRCIVWSVILA